MGTKEFWRVVRSRAWADTKKRAAEHAEITMLSMIVAAVAVVTIWYTLGEAPAAEEIIPRLVGTAAVLLLLAWTYFSRLLAIPAEMDSEKSVETTTAREKIAELTAPPERISLADFASIATLKYGWDFQKEEDLLFFDFIDGIRHAVSDGIFELEGRKGCLGQPEDRKNFYFVDPIPKEHVKKTQIDVPGFFKKDVNNYEVHTWSFSDEVSSSDLYCDIHIASSAKAIAWLEGSADRWKGQRKQVESSAEARRDQFRSELRHQGVPHSVPDGSEQGRLWSPGDPPEGRKVE